MVVKTFNDLRSDMPPGTIGAISGTDIRNLTDTVESGLNSLSNRVGTLESSSGGGAPAIIHGSIDLSTYPGVVVGAVDNAQRLANGIAMQAAFDEANTNKKYVEAPDGHYEYNASRVETNVPLQGGGTTSVKVGLVCPYDVPGLHGQFADQSKTAFIQYNNDHPALTLGSGNGEVKTTGAEYRGITTSYGGNVVPTVNTRGWLIGSMFQCKFDQLRYDKYQGGGSVKPYIGWDHVNYQGSWFFSCQVGTLFVDAGQEHVMRIKVNGTGNTYHNLYIGRSELDANGNLALPTVNGAIFAFEDGHQGAFQQINLEWQDAPRLMQFINTRAVTFDSIHIEGCNLTGANPCVVYNEISSVNMRALQLFDVGFDTGHGASGTVDMFRSWGDSQTIVDNIDARWRVVNTTYGYANLPFRLYNPAPDHDHKPNFIVRNFHAQGQDSTFSLDTTLPAATTGGVSDFGEYVWNRGLSRTEDSTIWSVGASGSETLYGAHRHSRLRVWDPITANKNIILSNKLAPTGFGSTVNCQVGDTREIVRDIWATGAFNVLVRNPTNTTTIATLGTPGTAVRLIFDGTNWVTA